MGPADRFREIEDLAEFVAETHCPNSRIEPEEIADQNGITFNYGNYGGAFDGLLECLDGAFHVFGNLDQVKSPVHARARFTFGHELGHYYIDEHRRALEGGVGPHGSFTDYQSNNPAEQEADAFAAALLMPAKRFCAQARRLSPGVAAIKALVEAFGTSYSSTAIRYAKSNTHEVMVMRWTPEGRKWCWSSKDLYEKTRNMTYKQIGRLPAGSLTDKALKGNLQAEISAGSTLSSWCPRVSSGSRSDLIVLEEVLSLGKYGVLTILYPD